MKSHLLSLCLMAGASVFGAETQPLYPDSNQPAAPRAAFPLKVSSNHRYLVNRNDVPFYWQGDTQWELFKDFTFEDAKSVLADRAAKGFSAIQVMLLGVHGGTKPNVNGDRPFINNDPGTPNEAYFKEVDAVIKTADQFGIVLVIGIYHQAEDYSRLITTNNARRWARWLGERYKNCDNVIWAMYPRATNSFKPIMLELAAGLDDGSGGRQLITVHPDPWASSSWIHDERWLAFNTCQTYSSGFRNYEMTAKDYAMEPTKPVVDGEARYEDEAGTTPLQVRNGAYWSCLAGGFYSYGQGGNWMSPTNWKSWINSPGSRQMKVLGNIFRSLEWWKLVPDQSVISGIAEQRVAARSSDGDWILAYLPRGGKADINMDRMTSSKPVDAFWIDPKTGERRVIGTYSNSGTASFVAPAGWDDAVLLLDATGARPIDSRLGISPNKRYFVNGHGGPVFWLGSTQWSIYRGYTTDEARIVLENIAAKGFTVVATMLAGWEDGTVPNKDGERPWLNNDPSTPNEAYFKNVDAVVRMAGEYGLYIRLGLLHNRQLKSMSGGKGRAYAKWVAERYKNAPNVFYSIHGDVTNPDLIAVVREMAAAIKETAGKDVLISQKPDPAPNSSGKIQDEPWLDYTQSQSFKWIDQIYPFVTQDYNRVPTKPTVMDEGAYEGGSEYGFEVTPLIVRRQAYYAYLAGGSHTYGHNDMWRVLPTWQKALDAPGAIQMGVLKRIFTDRFEWWKLVPDQSLFVNGGKTKGEVLQLAARHEGGRWALFYLAEPAKITVRLDRVGASHKLNACWIDPRNGNRVTVGSMLPEGEKQFTPPEKWEDAILLLESES
ncbi:MAG: DUF4038 domain-containing protein [Verrucomicrobiota bacterium]